MRLFLTVEEDLVFLRFTDSTCDISCCASFQPSLSCWNRMFSCFLVFSCSAAATWKTIFFKLDSAAVELSPPKTCSQLPNVPPSLFVVGFHGERYRCNRGGFL